MSARRCSIRQGSSTISTSSHTVGRAPLSDIRERLGNLRNTTAVRSNTAGKPSIDIWQKSVNAVAAVPSASQSAESSASLDVDALLARRARRKALRESTTRNASIEAPLHDVFTREASDSQQGVSRAVPDSPQAITSTETPRIFSPLPESNSSPHQQDLSQKNKSKAMLYESEFKLKSAEERIDFLMKEMEELRIFATVSAQFQNEAEEERQNLIKATQQTELESLKEQNRQLRSENSSLQSTLEAYQSQLSSHEIQRDAKLKEAEQSYRSLQSHLAAKETANNELQTHLDEFKEFMEDKLRVSEKKSKSLEADLISKENAIIELREDGDKLKQLLDEVTRESEEKCEGLQRDLNAKECENRELRGRYKELKQESEKTTMESKQKYENLLNNLHAKDIENQKLLEQFNELKQELENKTREKDQKLHTLQADLDAQETMNSMLQKRCDQLKQALDNATRDSDQNYGLLQTDLETSKSENKMLTKLCDDLKQELEKLRRESEHNCNSLRADLEASERENDELARAIEEIEEQNSAIEVMVDAYEKELHELRSANRKLEGEKESMTSKLASKDVVKQECSEKLSEMKDRYSELQELYLHSKIELDQVQSNLSLSQNTVRELTKEINYLSSEKKRLSDDRRSHKATMESFNGKKIDNSKTSLSASQKVFGIADEGSVSGIFTRERIESDALQSYMKHRQSHLRG